MIDKLAFHNTILTLQNYALRLLFYFRMFLFDPYTVLKKIFALPLFFMNGIKYYRKNIYGSFSITWPDIYYCTHNRFSPAGNLETHYFYMDIWAARKVIMSNLTDMHFDVGSRLDGFVSHLLPLTNVTYLDIRHLKAKDSNLSLIQGNLQKLPFRDDSVFSLSCLHVLEHIGLGRYGDPVDPMGPRRQQGSFLVFWLLMGLV